MLISDSTLMDDKKLAKLKKDLDKIVIRNS